MNEQNEKINVVVVGAGPAGIACALTIARAGKKVLLVERGNFAGSKNMFGGALYKNAIEEFFPNFLKDGAPVERLIIKNDYVLMGDKDATTISYNKVSDDIQSFTVLRPKWDKWMASQAEKEGVCLAINTTVRELIVKDNKVIGIKTDFEEYYCDLVVLADGVNSLLAKQISLRKEIPAKNVALGVKEVLTLSPEIIEERFNLAEGQGCSVELVGGAMQSMLGLGYLYTNKNSIAIGIGVSLEELKQRKIKPFELLEEVKSHPVIEPLIKGAKLLEYSAHLISEGGFKALPKLVCDGVLVVGDAAGLVNNVHWEGTNLAMSSGKLAALTVIDALNKNDFSQKILSQYEKALKKSYVVNDMRSYRNVMEIVHANAESYLCFWIKKINEFFKTFTTVDGVAKKKKFFSFGIKTVKQRGIIGLFKDIFSGIRIILEIFLP